MRVRPVERLARRRRGAPPDGQRGRGPQPGALARRRVAGLGRPRGGAERGLRDAGRGRSARAPHLSGQLLLGDRLERRLEPRALRQPGRAGGSPGLASLGRGAQRGGPRARPLGPGRSPRRGPPGRAAPGAEHWRPRALEALPRRADGLPLDRRRGDGQLPPAAELRRQQRRPALDRRADLLPLRPRGARQPLLGRAQRRGPPAAHPPRGLLRAQRSDRRGPRGLPVRRRAVGLRARERRDAPARGRGRLGEAPAAAQVRLGRPLHRGRRRPPQVPQRGRDGPREAV